ncbi:MAG: hypothetical protein ACJAS0_002856 [Alcanivorax borkumensis]|jgi:hypothetical protein
MAITTLVALAVLLPLRPFMGWAWMIITRCARMLRRNQMISAKH